MQFINIGFGNLISAQRLIAVVSPDSAPVKRLVQESRDRGMLIDATYGRKTASVLIMDSDHVVLSALAAERLRSTGTGVDCEALLAAPEALRPRMLRLLLDRLPTGRKDLGAVHLAALEQLAAKLV